jgi:hypothetical protein
MVGFPRVGTTPADTARARLFCADMGEYSWSVARRRERTGVTREEALTLLAQEHLDPAAFGPRAKVIDLTYAFTVPVTPWPEQMRDLARDIVQRVCLEDMLGTRDTPTVEPATSPSPRETGSATDVPKKTPAKHRTR